MNALICDICDKRINTREDGYVEGTLVSPGSYHQFEKDMSAKIDICKTCFGKINALKKFKGAEGR